MSWILPVLFRLVFHEMPNSCIVKKPRIWQVFWYMTWYGKHIRKKYRWRQVLWADALIQMPRKTPERNPTHRRTLDKVIPISRSAKCRRHNNWNIDILKFKFGYWGFTSLKRYFSHITTWKQEIYITNLWKFERRGRESNPGPLVLKPRA